MANLLSQNRIQPPLAGAAFFRAAAVIVLYRLAPEDSPAYRSLIRARETLSRHQGRVSILLWDNSPEACHSTDLPEDVTYWHEPGNPGVALAYNRALEIAVSQKSDWLVTLDQDTTVPPDFLASMKSISNLLADRIDIGAIVPQIAIGEKLLSPNHFIFGAIPRWYQPGFCGTPNESVFAFNSGAMLRVAALQQIGGYDLRFPLEYSDTAMFRKLHQHGKRVYINGEVRLRHEFSLIEMNRLLSEVRYRRTLLAETALWDLHMNWLAGCERTARLALRMIRQWIRGDRTDLRRVTREFLALRLLRSKKTRLRMWRELMEQQCSQYRAPAGELNPRLKVSVCMAAWNGSQFIQQQLESILPQLSSTDEVIVVDDCSQDDTIARIRQFEDSRIRLFTHHSNQGIVATFEEALRRARGAILFLCDDDDLWAPSKIERFLRAFETHPDAQVVTSKVTLIDEDGFCLPDARVNRHGHFTNGFWRNIFINHYQGSAMAIRADLLGTVLPFPRRKSFLHDVWIGTRNDASGGKTAFIDEPLVYYRRHSRNASGKHSLPQQIRIRIDLLIAHIACLLLPSRTRDSKA